MDTKVRLATKLYPYQVTHSKRAKYLRLKLSHQGQLSVVIPDGVSLHKAHCFVQSQAQWIEHKLQQLPPSMLGTTALCQLNLKYLNEQWSLTYLADPKSCSLSLVVEPANYQLQLTGQVEDHALLSKVLGRWLKEKAVTVIPARLAELAEEHGFHYRKVSLRGQKMRWGSCSSQKNISLNYKLLLLPPEVVDYVLIHELCHTLEMNHSARFWALVKECDPHYQQHEQALKVLGKSIPL